MSVLRTLIRRPVDPEPARHGALDLTELWNLGGSFYTTLGYGTNPTADYERIENNFAGYVRAAYKSSGVVGAVLQARLLPFSQLRFLYQEINDGRPGKLFDDPALDMLRRPWMGAVTQDLLSRMEVHGSLAGNAYVAKRRSRLKVLRPDWTTIVRGSTEEDADPLDTDVVGYIYAPPGGRETVLLPDEVAHYAPLPDPEAEYRGMSWLTPALRQIESHQAATIHKQKFFTNAATPNLLIKWDPRYTAEQAEQYKKLFLETHMGASNAWGTLFLGGATDATVIGKDFQQLTFKEIQGADETLIAATAGVPPIIANLSEGIASATYSNYGQAKKHYADTTVRYLAEQAASSFETILPPPRRNSRLWFDTRDTPFFRDDAKSEAEVHKSETEMMRSLVDGGWDPESVKAAVMAAGDWSLLKHTGKLSVQLQDPTAPAAGEDEETPVETKQAPPDRRSN